MKAAKKSKKSSAKSGKAVAKPATRVRAPGPVPPGVPFVGEIALFAFGFAPSGWLPCDGRLLPIMRYQPLMALIGTTYGGNGQTTLGLPKLKPAGPSGPGYYIAAQGAFPSR
jgi:hypothetical protein